MLLGCYQARKSSISFAGGVPLWSQQEVLQASNMPTLVQHKTQLDPASLANSKEQFQHREPQTSSRTRAAHKARPEFAGRLLLGGGLNLDATVAGTES